MAKRNLVDRTAEDIAQDEAISADQRSIEDLRKEVSALSAKVETIASETTGMHQAFDARAARAEGRLDELNPLRALIEHIEALKKLVIRII